MELAVRMEKKGQGHEALRRSWLPDFQPGGAAVIPETGNNTLGRGAQMRGEDADCILAGVPGLHSQTGSQGKVGRSHFTKS